MRRVRRPAAWWRCATATTAPSPGPPPIAALDRWLALYREVARANRGEPDAGAGSPRGSGPAGFEDLDVDQLDLVLATADDRAWWGGLWADRLAGTALARQLLDEGRATRGELDEVAAAWHAWAEDVDGWFSVLHGEVLVRVPPRTPR